MKRFRAEVTVLPKDGVLDTQGKAVEKTLHRGGYLSVSDVRVGRSIRLTVAADDEASAEAEVREIADDLLVNDLIESFTVKLEAAK